MSNYNDLKEQIVKSAQELMQKGFLMATGGNISIRARDKTLFAITPSNFDYQQMSSDDVCLLNFDMSKVEGVHKPSIEASMHSAVYQARPDVYAIVHTHQVYASALTLIKAPIPALFDEQVRFLGRQVDIIPYAPSGTSMLKKTIARHVRDHNNAYLMQNHGALILGTDMQRAIHNVEILEKCSLAYLLSLCAEKKVNKLPLAVREIAFAKLRKDQKKITKKITCFSEGALYLNE